jgi:type I restriction-modification system DNA methylase subunit
MADDYFKRTHWNRKDEYYTPQILVEPILKYIPDNSTIWCPFDTNQSEFVLILKEAGHNVIYSHLWYGQDFFEYEPDEPYDYIISNPPFSLKKRILERLYKLDKPFAMIMGLPILNYQEIGNFFYEKQSEDKWLQLLIVDKKVSYKGY